MVLLDVLVYSCSPEARSEGGVPAPARWAAAAAGTGDWAQATASMLHIDNTCNVGNEQAVAAQDQVTKTQDGHGARAPLLDV